MNLVKSTVGNTKVTHVDPKEFYCYYHTLKLYFANGYDISKYGLKSEKWMNKFDEDPSKTIFIHLAKKIDNGRDALLLLICQFIKNENFFIIDFDFENEYYKTWKRYETNINALIYDFQEVCNKYDIQKMITTGQLAESVMLQKKYIVLFLFVDKIIPIVSLSSEYESKNKPEIIAELFYGNPQQNKLQKVTDNLFTKLKYFVIIKPEVKNQLAKFFDSLVFC